MLNALFVLFHKYYHLPRNTHKLICFATQCRRKGIYGDFDQQFKHVYHSWSTRPPLLCHSRVHRNYFSQMQGGEVGTRPVTAVLTRAERDKFNREPLKFPFTPARRQQLGTQIPQIVDFDQFCVRWNEDVAVSEHHIRYGRLERDPGPENIINRKTAASLKSYLTNWRKCTNAKATMENVRG